MLLSHNSITNALHFHRRRVSINALHDLTFQNQLLRNACMYTHITYAPHYIDLFMDRLVAFSLESNGISFLNHCKLYLSFPNDIQRFTK